MRQSIKIVYIFLFFLSTFCFFSPIAISLRFFSFLYAILLTPILVYYFPKGIFSANTLVGKGVILIILSSLLSIMGANLIWNQELLMTLSATLPMFAYTSFFFLQKEEIEIPVLEKIILIIGLLCAFVQFLSLYIFPDALFVGVDFFSDGRGFQRILPGGMGFLFLAFFLSLRKIVKEKSRISIAFFIIFFISIILSLTRLYIFAAFVLTLLYTLRKTSVWIKILSVLFIIITLNYLYKTEFVQNLLVLTNDEIGNNTTEYVRFGSADYYFNEFPPNGLAKIIGSGVNTGESNFDLSVKFQEDQYGYYISDIGFIGLYVRYGLLSIIGYLLIYYIVLFKVGERYDYAKYYLFFILINGFSNHATFHPDFIASLSVAFYIINKEYLENMEGSEEDLEDEESVFEEEI